MPCSQVHLQSEVQSYNIMWRHTHTYHHMWIMLWFVREMEILMMRIPDFCCVDCERWHIHHFRNLWPGMCATEHSMNHSIDPCQHQTVCSQKVRQYNITFKYFFIWRTFGTSGSYCVLSFFHFVTCL